MTDTLAIRGGTPVVPKELHHRWPVITAEDKAAVLEEDLLATPDE